MLYDIWCRTSVGNELERDGHVDRLLQECLDPLLAEGLAEPHQQRRVARPAVLEVVHAREVLPGGRLRPALDDAFIALVEGVLEVQQRDHQAQRESRTTGRRYPRTDHLGHAAEQVHVLDVLAGANRLGEQMRDGGFQFLPRHTRSEYGQRVAQVDHLIQAAAEEIGRVAHRGDLPGTPRNRGCRGMKLGEIIH